MEQERRTLKVVLVDDSALVRQRVRELLSAVKDVEVVGQAADAAEGLRLIPELRPDVVVLDIELPGTSGISILDELRRHEPSPIVIMLTNYDHRQLRRVCIEAGADFFFHKSTEFEKVVEVLELMARRLSRNPEGSK
jgi:DNA-binding NarL/FixJ family response regulator